MRQRRRAERGRFAPPVDRTKPGRTRRETEERLRKLLLVGMVLVVSAVIVLVGIGWYTGSFQPPRKAVAVVDGKDIQLRDIVPYTVLEGSIVGIADPRTGLNNYMRDAVLRLRASGLGVSVTPEAVQESVIATFEPSPDGSTATPDVLTALGQEAIDTFVGIIGVTEDEYRVWVEGGILLGEVQDHFASTQPDTAEQVWVEWIVTASSVTTQEAIDRINGGENFGAVAAEVNAERNVADENGVVGWVPRGAVPEIDSAIFAESLLQNQPVGPLVTTIGSMALQVTNGPSVEPVSPIMQSLVAVNSFQAWIDEQADELVRDVDLDPDDLVWVVEKINSN